jgi:hypothetical protein
MPTPPKTTIAVEPSPPALPEFTDNTDKQMELFNNEFEVVLKEVETLTACEKGVRKALTSSLDKLFEFGIRLLADNHVAETFVLKRGENWDKVALRNGFQPLVKLAFPNAGDTQRTKYAYTLLLAKEIKPPTKSFKDWLGEEDGTLEKRYAEAVTLFSKRQSPQLKANVRDERLQLGLDKVQASAISPSIALTISDAEERRHHDCATALLRFVGNGEAVIVGLLESSDDAIEAAIRQFADPQTAKRRVLSKGKLYRLFRAIEFVNTVSSSHGSKDEKFTVIRAIEVGGKTQCHVQSVCTAYNFVWAEAIISETAFGLPLGKEYFLDEETAENLIRHVLVGKKYKHKIDDNGALTLTEKGAKRPSFVIAEGIPSNYQAMRIGQFRQTIVHSLPFDSGPADTIIRTIEKVKEWVGLRQNTETEIVPKVWSISSDENSIFLNTELPSFAPLTLSKSKVRYQVPPDRYLRVADLENLGKAVTAYELTLTGGIIDDQEECAALVLWQTVGKDTLRCMIPFCIDMTGTYTNVCIPIPA